MDKIVSNRFMYIFYLLIHLIFTLLQFIQETFSYLSSKFVQFCDVLNIYQRQPLCLKSVSELSKKPKHVTVLLGTEDPCNHSLSNLIIWCLAVGIPYISFHDFKGVLNKNHAELEYEIEKKKPKECTIIWHNDPPIGHKNGFTGRKIHVKLLSDSHGKNGIVNVCKKVALSENITDLSIDSISEKLHKHFEFPDPDLGLICGNVFSLFGYPPWQVSLTEFVNIKSHHDVTFEQFADILSRYSKREQRLGK